MLVQTYLAAVLVFGLSLLVGRAIMAASGRERWAGIEPAVGFAALVAVEGLLARIPGSRVTLVLGLVALVAVSVFWLRKPSTRRLPGPPQLWVAILITTLLTAVPFLVSGRWGLLGMGYNNDLALHLAWAQSLISDFGTEPSIGYPLGPHGLVAALSSLPRLDLGPAFIGLLVALPALTAMTAWPALGKLAPGRRLLAAVMVAMTYLMASYFAQAAFKEVAAAIFSKITCFAFFSRIIEQPRGRWGNWSSISLVTVVAVFPIKALNLFSKLYSGLELPTKSKTVKQSLSSANRSPRPNCCKKMVKLSVGRKNKTVSISGISIPSLKISTTNK